MDLSPFAIVAFASAVAIGPRCEFDLTASAITGHRLENGLVVLVSSRASSDGYFAVFRRHGLLDDGPGETQWSHLLEHLAVRATDTSELRGALPARGSLPPATITVNGETTGRILRLEAIFPADDPARLPDLLPRARSWIDFEIALEHASFEAGRAVQELEVTESAGTAHKWALAAWNQAARGETRVELRNAVTGAARDELEEAARRLRGASPPVLLFHGGIDPAAVLAFARTLPAPPPAVPATSSRVDPSRRAARIEWDSRLTVIVGSCELPVATASDRLCGMLATRVLAQALAMSPRRLTLLHPTASFEPEPSGSSMLWFVTATVAPGATADRAREALSHVLAGLRDEFAADEEAIADRIAAMRDLAFETEASGGRRAARSEHAPFGGMQEALDAAQHRILLSAYTNDEVAAAYSGLDPARAAAAFTAALDADRWSWLTIAP